jgi:hypothetical protein
MLVADARTIIKKIFAPLPLRAFALKKPDAN